MKKSFLTTDNLSAHKSIRIIDKLNRNSNGQVKNEILNGLMNTPKFISSKYFYDSKGSKLFEEITNLDEYYPTKTEKSILRSIGNKLDLDFENINIIELGSGDHSKIRLLLKQIDENLISTVTYYPIDISRSAIEESSKYLLNEFPALKINGILTDFLNSFELPDFRNNSLFCFLGSTIGNLSPKDADNFVKKVADIMKSGDRFLLGLDMVKDVGILNKAYNDNQNITAEFNKNILNVVNSILQTNFNTDDFEHIASYNEKEQRIEMHLKALKHTDVIINNSNTEIQLNENELINTEYSYKFTVNDINRIGSFSGLKTENIFTDEKKWFSLVEFKK